MSPSNSSKVQWHESCKFILDSCFNLNTSDGSQVVVKHDRSKEETWLESFLLDCQSLISEGVDRRHIKIRGLRYLFMTIFMVRLIQMASVSLLLLVTSHLLMLICTTGVMQSLLTLPFSSTHQPSFSPEWSSSQSTPPAISSSTPEPQGNFHENKDDYFMVLIFVSLFPVV